MPSNPTMPPIQLSMPLATDFQYSLMPLMAEAQLTFTTDGNYLPHSTYIFTMIMRSNYGSVDAQHQLSETHLNKGAK
jgi:hypothetical protein